jgi:tRNA pseudouridine55 synthase
MNEGFLVIDKPAGITSHDVVAAIRAVTGVKKVGHTGTLDPFATGVLPLALGRATRLIQYLDESVKVYDATIQLGSATDTGDPTGVVVREAPLPSADAAEVQRVLDGFLGESQQVPPQYSAVKVRGKPMYQYARKGEQVEVQARTITIRGLEMLAYDGQSLRVRITCSRGTYARVLADDIAVALGSAGHLSALSRARSGPFFIDDAVSFDTVAQLVAPDSGHPWHDVLLSRQKGPRVPWAPRQQVADALSLHVRSSIQSLSNMPLLEVSAADAQRVRQGGMVPMAPTGLAMGSRFLVVCGDDLVAVAEQAPQTPKALRVL